jgi:AmmeMemoRadiSam system protein B
MVSGIDSRPPEVAGSFYPEDKKDLSYLLKKFFDGAKEIHSDKQIKALIVPHAGYIYSGETAAWGFAQLPKQVDRQHFVLIGPSHHYPFTGLVSSSSNFWSTPLGKLRHIIPSQIDEQIIINSQPHMPEHCLEVELPFLQFIYGDKISISCFLTGTQVKMENAADFFLRNYPSSIFIISSDLSHYLPQNQAQEKDKKTIETILKLDRNYFLTEENTACGAIGILILLSMAQKRNWQRKLIYYATSAAASKDESAVVGYASIGFY